MSDRYVHQEIERKWQGRWEQDRLYRAAVDPDRKKHYALTMLPYPSGDMHIGHWYAMAPSDARARYMRMRGYNVLFPMGFDAFGLPAENAAIRHGVHPFKWTMANIERQRGQLKAMGAVFDWDREAITCLPGFYKWTQWFFLQFFKAGLAYRAHAPVDFCPECNTTLAREQVWGEDRHCERCDTPIIRKELKQWFFRITKYADELLDFSKIDWPDRVRIMQTNWVGRSEGAEVTFRSEAGDPMTVFTTRPDTLWGATFMVLAPEHPLVAKLTTPDHRVQVGAYVLEAGRKTEIARLAADKEKTGVFIGAYAINPVNNARIPIWVADYVMMTYGTGAIMAVPAHDERDFQFALKYGLPIVPVIGRPDGVCKSYVMAGTMRDGFAGALAEACIPFEEREGGLCVAMTVSQTDRFIELAHSHIKSGCWCEVVGARWVFVFDDVVVPFDSADADRLIMTRCRSLEPAVRDRQTVMEMLWHSEFYGDVLFHVEHGPMINSGPFSGTPGDRAVSLVTQKLEADGTGAPAVNYRLRDWLISRQRYWGSPIPIVYCAKCGIQPVPEKDLPVLLPEDAEIPPSGENALKFHKGFLHTTCPQCGGPAQRETDTMDTFVCSSWYQYAYLSPYYEGEVPFDPKEGAYWLPVDMYTGGVEHATMHLIYTRFFTKALRDLGLVKFDEPMLRLRNQGIILGADREKMSKSRGNVVSPDEEVARYGADTVRAYLMFGYRWEQGGPWDPQGIEGLSRFLYRVWDCIVGERERVAAPADPITATSLRRLTHQTIRRATEDMEQFAFNTYVANLMEFNNALIKAKATDLWRGKAWSEGVRTLILLLAPVCPHVAEELWERIGQPYSVHQQAWPVWDAEVARDEIITLVLQVNGKVRDRVQVSADISEDRAKEVALASESVRRHVAGKQVVSVVYAPGRLVNVVVR